MKETLSGLCLCPDYGHFISSVNYSYHIWYVTIFPAGIIMWLQNLKFVYIYILWSLMQFIAFFILLYIFLCFFFFSYTCDYNTISLITCTSIPVCYIAIFSYYWLPYIVSTCSTVSYIAPLCTQHCTWYFTNIVHYVHYLYFYYVIVSYLYKQ